MHPGSTALCLESTMQSKTKTIITVEPPVSDYPKCQAKWSLMEQDVRPYSVNIFLIRIWLTHAPMLKECFIYERKQFWENFWFLHTYLFLQGVVTQWESKPQRAYGGIKIFRTSKGSKNWLLDWGEWMTFGSNYIRRLKKVRVEKSGFHCSCAIIVGLASIKFI